MRNHLMRHFAEFGEIESIVFRSKRKFAFIQFKNATSAAAALAKSEHIIGERRIVVKVKKAFDNLQPKVNLLTPPDEDSPLNILNKLDDDCLAYCFEKLQLKDLCNVADVCKQFKSIATSVFARKYSEFSLDHLKNDNHIKPKYDCFCKGCRQKHQSDMSTTLNEIPLTEIDHVFRVFGAHMKNIQLDQEEIGDHMSHTILLLLIEYCSADNAVLKQLVLNNFVIKGLLIQKLQPVFARLTNLYICGGSFNRNVVTLLSFCVQLKYLILEKANFYRALAQTFPALEQLTLYAVNDLTESALERFMQLNKKLKQLTITDKTGQLSSNIFHSIGINLHELEFLWIHEKVRIITETVNANLKQFENLKLLTNLGLNCTGLSVNILLKSLNEASAPIKVLRLSDFMIDSTIRDSLMKFTAIEILRFRDGNIKTGQLTEAVKVMPNLSELSLTKFTGLNINDVKAIIKSATKLKSFRLGKQNDLTIYSNDYKEMVELIKNRRNDIKLYVNAMGSGIKVSILTELREMYQDLLKIDAIDYDSMDDDDNDDESDDSDSDSDSDDDILDFLFGPAIMIAVMFRSLNADD